MDEPGLAVLGLILSGVLLWIRRGRRKFWQRALLLVLALLLAYPALNYSYIAAKEIIAGY